MERKAWDNIIFIATYKEMDKRAEEVMKDLGVKVEIVHALNLPHSVEVVRKGLKKGSVDAVITRGGTALKIRDEFNIPVIEIEVTVLDILKSVEKAKKFGEKIGIIGFPNIICNISSISKLMGVEMFEIQINSIQESTDAVIKASSLGADVIVGDRIAVETAARFGLKGELIESDSYECIAKSFYRAKEIAEVRRKELARSEEIRVITELTHSGIIAVDTDAKITLFNVEASKILNLNPADAIYKYIDEVVPEFKLSKMLKYGETEYKDEICCVNGRYIILNKSSVIINNKLSGVVASFQKLEKIQNIERKARKKLIEKGHIAKYTFDSIIGTSDTIQRAIKKAKDYSLVDSSILINGETGTGKEVFAQSIHNYSLRKDGPFVAVNCAALPYSLLESELFGYVKGAFTGAKEEGKPGLFEQAHGGTIFLDELGGIPMTVQARLLRVIQEGQVQRIGDDKIISVDVRIISATNDNLIELIKQKRFREDLYYRINVLNIKLPNLRERAEDIPKFVEHFIDIKSKKYKKVRKMIDKRLIIELSSLAWPGNIRQLDNIAERLVVESKNREITFEDLTLVLDGDMKEACNSLNIDFVIEETIEKALKVSNNNKTMAAKTLGIDRTTLWRKMNDLGME